MVHSARSSFDSGSDTSTIQQLQQVEFIGMGSTLRDACETIIRKIREERDVQQAALVNATADLLKRAGKAVVAAREPKDLDTSIQELSHAAGDPNLTKSFDNRADFYVRRLQSASTFVTRFQDCLARPNRVDGRTAVDSFRSLLTDNSGAMQSMEIPRSAIIAHLPPAPARSEETPAPARSPAEVNASVATVLDKLHALDDLPVAIRGLTALRDEMQNSNRGYGNRSSEVNNLLQRLHELEDAYAEQQNGLDRSPDTWWGGRYANGGGSEVVDENLLVPLRAQLLTLALPRLLGAPDTEKPASGERVDAFLNRLIDLARKRSDWPTVARGLEYRRLLQNPRSPYDGGQNGSGRDDATAFKEFFAGQNFELAAQYEQAVASYLAALSTGTQEIPLTLISERLATIKKAHPKEYSGGEHTGYSADASAYTEAIRAAYRARMQTADDAAGTPAAPVALSVSPAKTTMPAPSASPSPSPISTPTPAASATPSAAP